MAPFYLELKNSVFRFFITFCWHISISFLFFFGLIFFFDFIIFFIFCWFYKNKKKAKRFKREKMWTNNWMPKLSGCRKALISANHMLSTGSNSVDWLERFILTNQMLNSCVWQIIFWTCLFSKKFRIFFFFVRKTLKKSKKSAI